MLDERIRWTDRAKLQRLIGKSYIQIVTSEVRAGLGVTEPTVHNG